MFKKICLLISITASAYVFAATDHTGKIAVLRATTDSSLHGESQKGIILFKLDVAIHQNCTWLGVKKGNSYFVSTLLSAQARSQEVRIWYDESYPDSGICWAHTIQVNP